ncbi:hypothetical protein C493_09293 [Natronolimnohabitans innermongolicus JCM 12255]|uniref:DUF7978 domain-containing protein n=1 Tax=Natronolimnohabitans innermongolicus JCM 12255 TaxID=1227499 RepID=L9X6G6_9EURY|nr:hypothetical protein C493_09293 [Natronolimnohabitans innermongolicus JCM 12255]
MLTFVLLLVDSAIELEGEDYLLETVGMVFYNAQFVDTELSDGSTTETITMLSEMGPDFPELAYTLVPVCLLVGAGYLVARGASDNETTAEDGLKVGASVVVGYLPLVLVGTTLFEVSEDVFDATFTAGPATGSAVLLAGLAFPIVLGAIGGYLSQR